MRCLVTVLGLCLLLTSAVSCAAPDSTPPTSLQPGLPLLPSGEEVFDALDTETLLDIGYSEPDRVVVVEGIVVRTFYASTSKGKPTFLDFHDPYEAWFKCVIWEEDRETQQPVRERFIKAFPPNPETYFLNRKVRVRGKINIYKGAPEVILTEPSQIWTVDETSQNYARVVRVIDGDTVEIEGGERLRYIGIDTPEVARPSQPGEYLGEEAAEKNRELVLGKKVRLEGDVQDRDEYGRLLRYVWLDDILVNAELVRLGYAYSYTLPPNVKYQELFLRLEREAREKKLGLWAE